MLLLKYLDALEHDKALEAQLDHNTAMTGDDLLAFVNQKLFPCLHGFKAKATGPNAATEPRPIIGGRLEEA